ncbi:MAG: HAMP domain-containing protein [Rhizobacter sp.]|nr:HAMP domain-containing protein [Rhizobacter sp.]
MKSLYLRIYATVVVVLLLFAVVSGWMLQRHLDQERNSNEQVMAERLSAWAELLGRSLPPADAPPGEQAAALRDWSQRLRVPLALDAASGERIFASESFLRRTAEGLTPFAFRLEDGRTVLTLRPGFRGPRRGEGGEERARRAAMPPPWPFLAPGLPRGTGLVIVLVVLFFAVAAGAYPVVRRLTRRLETLKQGVEQFGAGALSQRVPVTGADEVAALAASFNVAAERIEALVKSHRSFLANASHELRSPLARLRMAVSMLDGATSAERVRLKAEIAANVGELDSLVEEVLLASRLDVVENGLHRDRVDLLAVAAEEAARVGAHVDGTRGGVVDGDERLLRRAIRNLLENGQRYGGGDLAVMITSDDGSAAAPSITVQVCDRGPGVPAAMRERIFEPFFRLPGHAEQAGGVGLGLSLVKQIAERHGGSVRCEAREGGGSRFVMVLPAAARAASPALGATS